MRANLFWFSDGQWARIEPFIPSNRRGVKPKNNRRILSGIMHVLKSGCRWVDCPPEYGPAKTVYNRFNRWSAQGIWQSIFEAAAEPAEPPERMALDSTHVKAHRCAGGGKGGASEQAIGITKGGRNSKIHGLVDKLYRPWVLILTPGNTADCTGASQRATTTRSELLLSPVPRCRRGILALVVRGFRFWTTWRACRHPDDDGKP